ncbi:hypothetical protein [Micromonospora craniellae]|uniref:Uncharacterized protein n=1 Tax=Micromonospora craniellae TaxID=2294034 RepID=A0A372FQK7_9ACTN|nr:hypothetical protein [Micromonospora craniellae]QOC93125.1 hypothetical protein ID554_05340 [Micromonospora craniellae]RFS40967.1 hypothetical protein D0Q02_30015 [Micromonospora craniellae]
MDVNPLSDLIRAFARADWDAADAVAANIRQHGLPGSLRLIEAAFALAVHRHLGVNATPTDIAAFVSSARARYEQGATPPALETEGVIRAAVGEPELIANIPAETVLGIEIFVLGQMLLESNLTPTELDEFVAAAEQIAAEHLG